ncbi:hypothetical protein AAT19DRAFT_14306 [Rhodotorula toruloides]|uniref:Uncharacterized protein n=1 Tax=Rhodotorula toruloides TaxID=5286 RepID=A0A2T0AB99_RHOTO|nr:hypothetical protein AAT19DRAFT_14306 [Rhodotorula toruloides]
MLADEIKEARNACILSQETAFLATYGLKGTSSFVEGDLAPVTLVTEGAVDDYSDLYPSISGSLDCEWDMSISEYTKPLDFAKMRQQLDDTQVRNPLKRLCEDWDLVVHGKAVSEGADLEPKAFLHGTLEC